ncbi:hypothetical protein WP8S18E07_41530 [Escherichia coli]|nr:hypothetical protein WP8S18E07_41530 [Escherichia coli]
MSLLMTSQPIVINRDLACRIGLNEAIVLQQLHYWLNETNSGTEHGGIRWVYNTTEQWLEQFPFWSESTLKRTFASLKSLGVLRCQRQDYWPFFAIFNVRYWSLMLSAFRHFIITDWRGVFCQHSRFAFFL